jgi:hypothetical protein
VRPLSDPLHVLIARYQWVHIFTGILGNGLFVVGSVLFLWRSSQTAGSWLFIVGSALMMVGAIGSAIVKLTERARREYEQRQGRPIEDAAG